MKKYFVTIIALLAFVNGGNIMSKDLLLVGKQIRAFGIKFLYVRY
jgi:hypothetical protein